MSLFRRFGLLLVLACIRLHLSAFGLRSTLRRVRTLTERPPRPQPATLQDSARVGEDIRKVSVLLPGRVQCLEQALALYAMLRMDGTNAKFCLGAVMLPFVAHAWVEVDGCPVNADAEQLAPFARFPELPA